MLAIYPGQQMRQFIAAVGLLYECYGLGLYSGAEDGVDAEVDGRTGGEFGGELRPRFRECISYGEHARYREHAQCGIRRDIAHVSGPQSGIAPEGYMHGDRPRQHCGGKLPPQHIFKSEHGIVGSGDGHDRERYGQGSHCGAVAEYLHVHDVASAAFRQQEIRGHGGEHHGYSSQEKQLEEDYGGVPFVAEQRVEQRFRSHGEPQHGREECVGCEACHLRAQTAEAIVSSCTADRAGRKLDVSTWVRLLTPILLHLSACV